jgi:Rad3-related DNA helicase
VLSRIIEKVEDEDFIFNYSNRSNKSLIDDLGQLLLDLADKVRGGLLVFFPSY